MNKYSKLTDDEVFLLANQYTAYSLPENNYTLWRESLRRLDKNIDKLIIDKPVKAKDTAKRFKISKSRQKKLKKQVKKLFNERL